MYTSNIDKEDFFQSKYKYYRKFCFWIIVVGSLASISYFISDCQLFERFSWETLLPRTIILLPMLIYIFIYMKTESYRILVISSYIVMHLIMWNSIWAISYLPDRTYANEGFIIMHLLFFAIGFCAPFTYSTIFHSLVIVNIIISNAFLHYARFDLMLSLGLPCVIAICCVHYFMQKLYLEHYQTTRMLEHISIYDSLTGVYNRNALHKLVNNDTLTFNDSLGTNIGILLFDIDHFKKVNDTYGHASGDVVLKEITLLAEKCISEKDCIIRWGGEEFVVIIPECSEDKAYEIADSIRVAIEKADNGICPITVSVGVSTYTGGPYKDAIDRADRALYNAKENGRNCVKPYSSEM